MTTQIAFLLSFSLAAFLIVALAAVAGNVGINSSTVSRSTASRHFYGEQHGDLPNFHEVYPFLYRGGEPTDEGLKKLKEMGVKSIIDLRGSNDEVQREAAEAKQLGFITINLPMSSQPPTQTQVHTFIKAVEKAQAGGGPVFVHCMHGSDRTGCLVGIWRVTHDGWTYDQAYDEMRKYYFSPKFTMLSDTVKKYADHSGKKLEAGR